MMKRVKGQLLRSKAYKITGNGKNAMKVSVSELSDLIPGDYVYQEKLNNGIILLIPEDIYEN
jgi:hypothetical protein